MIELFVKTLFTINDNLEVASDTNLGYDNMNKVSLIILSFFAVFALCSCGSEPQVTACEEAFIEEPEYGTDYWGNVVFRGVKKVSKGWYHWDSNKECPFQNGYEFRILKNTPTRILKTDICDHCLYSWELHDNK